MDYFTIVLGLLFALTLHQGLSFLSRRRQKLPPGPTPLPLIGSLHLLGDKPHQSLAKLAKKHGPLMSLKFGQVTTVVVSSSAMAKEVLQKQDLAFSSRSIPDALHAHNQFQYSVVWLPVASRWRSLRKTLNSNIFSGNRLDANQHLRCRKVQELVAYCRKNSQTGGAVDVGRAAFRTSLNLLSNTIFSKDLTDPYSDSAKEFKDLVWNIMLEAGKPNLVDFYPALEKIDPQGIRRRMTIHFGKVLQMFGDLINERLQNGKSRHVDNDVLDILLTTSKEAPDEIDRTHIERLCLVCVFVLILYLFFPQCQHILLAIYLPTFFMLQDLFVAGTDTTSNTLEWAMAEVLKNPEKMKKAKAELSEIIGKGKLIEEADVSRLPYLRCIVKETLRLHPPVPFLIPRKVDQDVEVCGYNVPKGTQVLVNVWAIGRDDTIWDNALEFKPERFMESELDIRGRDFELLPFGAGRRICPGLPLAVRMVPVMLGSLLNSFDWKLEGGMAPKDLDMEEKFGITIQKANPLLAVPVCL
ncbi:OLC1v1010058C1 [Oldenlandia corymbosa var. corymbosa]|uniref:OLC1v1010058C1 n=1 Tax=Oldenlandia corymbosa var. corymbosa TaxID=529605 RepID=A0AAV1DQD1_OLDCO|nr:OLC1v1010058C1 [Oldenlandia corymbosa var. corymbosa]